MRPENRRILRAARAWTKEYGEFPEKALYPASAELIGAVKAAAKPAACLSPAQRDALERADILLRQSGEYMLPREPGEKVLEAHLLVRKLLAEAEPAAQGGSE